MPLQKANASQAYTQALAPYVLMALAAGGIYANSQEGSLALAEDYYNSCGPVAQAILWTAMQAGRASIVYDDSLANTVDHYYTRIGMGDLQYLNYTMHQWSDWSTINHGTGGSGYYNILQPGYGEIKIKTYWSSYSGQVWVNLNNNTTQSAGAITTQVRREQISGVWRHWLRIGISYTGFNNTNLWNSEYFPVGQTWGEVHYFINETGLKIFYEGNLVYEAPPESVWRFSGNAFVSYCRFDYSVKQGQLVSVPISEATTLLPKTQEMQDRRNKEIAIPPDVLSGSRPTTETPMQTSIPGHSTYGDHIKTEGLLGEIRAVLTTIRGIATNIYNAVVSLPAQIAALFNPTYPVTTALQNVQALAMTKAPFAWWPAFLAAYNQPYGSEQIIFQWQAGLSPDSTITVPLPADYDFGRSLSTVVMLSIAVFAGYSEIRRWIG